MVTKSGIFAMVHSVLPITSYESVPVVKRRHLETLPRADPKLLPKDCISFFAIRDMSARMTSMVCIR